MNLNIKATGTREEIAAMLRELAEKLESGQTPEGTEEAIAEPITVDKPAWSNSDSPAKLIAEPRKRLAIAPAKVPVKKDPVAKAKLNLSRAIHFAQSLVKQLRDDVAETVGAVNIVLLDLIDPAQRILDRLNLLVRVEQEPRCRVHSVRT